MTWKRGTEARQEKEAGRKKQRIVLLRRWDDDAIKLALVPQALPHLPTRMPLVLVVVLRVIAAHLRLCGHQNAWASPLTSYPSRAPLPTTQAYTPPKRTSPSHTVAHAHAPTQSPSQGLIPGPAPPPTIPAASPSSSACLCPSQPHYHYYHKHPLHRLPPRPPSRPRHPPPPFRSAGTSSSPSA